MNQEQIGALEEAVTRDYGNTAGLVILQRGETRYERYWNGFGPSDPIHVFSVTKSVISILIGIALDRGLIGSVDQRALDFFPDYAPKRGEKTLQTVTLRHLLTMTAPYKYRFAPYTKYFSSDDWVRASLDLLGGRKAPGEFRYAPLIGPDILSGILVRATGTPVRDFAGEALFSPLGIRVGGSVTFATKEEQTAFYQAGSASGWVADPKGVNTAGWGLCLTAMDLAKIGQLYLQKGAYGGARVVSPGWVEESTREQSRWGGRAYGYLWWVMEGGGFAALGDGGNTVYVNPEKELTVAMTGRFKPRMKDRVALIRERIEPMFEAEGDGVP